MSCLHVFVNRLNDKFIQYLCTGRLKARYGNDWASIGAVLGRSASSVKDKCRLMKDTCNSGRLYVGCISSLTIFKNFPLCLEILLIGQGSNTKPMCLKNMFPISQILICH